MRVRFCAYCRREKADEGFKFITNNRKGSTSAQCAICQEIRRLPRAELEEIAKAEAAERQRIRVEAALKKREAFVTSGRKLNKGNHE